MERNESLMKKNISIRKKKNSRGVAVIFTLGILGLLTVMALGFASTALLNRKIADNTSSAEYARHIAKNIALARAKWAVINTIFADTLYSTMPAEYSTDGKGKDRQDFLHKMDTVLDGVELYRVTNDTGTIKIQDNTARWQYVTDPNDNNRILGRYAYAIVPDSGHLDPVGNRGQTSVSGRYGFSEKEIGVYSLCNGDNGLGLNENPNAGDVAGIKFRTFKEFVSAFQNLSTDNKKNLLKGGYRIQLDPTPDAFWIDTNQDGKKTKDELYLRFNMPRTQSEWETMTVAKLIGEGAGESDSDIKYTSTTKNSVDFIPWLKYWTHSNGDWTADLMKKQIAANIIQYNRPGPADGSPSRTISDKMGDSDDWLNSPPKYAGIGRHPMLNELGFAVIVAAELVVVEETDVTGKVTDVKYTPKYFITVVNGAELINPFEVPTKDATVKFSGSVKIQINIFKSQTAIDEDTTLTPATTDFSPITETKDLDTSIADSDLVGWPGEEDFTLTLTFNSASWLSSPAYTKAESFWRASAMKTVTLPTFSLPGELKTQNKSEYLRKLLKINKVTYAPKNVVLLYGGDTNSHQRDIAMLTPTGTFKYEDETSTEICRPDGSNKVWVYQASFEAKDPLVNHYNSDWTFKNKKDGESSSVLETEEGNATSIKSINKKYPGTVFDDDGGMTDRAGRHKNSTILEKLLTDQENGSEVTLESAADPAWTNGSRLSSSYIRHKPMRSFWELGFISRAEAFKTLNLGRTRVFDEGTAYSARGGGTFAQGDANILDQIKFSDPTDQKDAQGKIDINARFHKVFEWVFNKDIASASGTTVNWFKDLITGTSTDPYNTTPVAGTERNVVCSNSSADCLSHQHSDSCTVNDCLAHLLMERSRILPFSNRADLLLDPDSTFTDFTKIPGYNDLDDTTKNKLKTLQRKVRNYLLNPGNETTDEAKSKLVREQYASRFMNLLKADSDEHIYIIVVAQSIKDIGGAPAFVDWNGDGEYSSSSVTIPDSNNDKMKKFLRTGYIRKKLYSDTDYEKIGSVATVDETITSTAVGTYNYGADKITGETKLIAEMVKDEKTGKWKMIGYRYVE